jgi:hypothetical protein
MEKLIPLFPKINKVNYDVMNQLSKSTCFFIPKGPKMFAWFTYYQNKSICLFYNEDKIFTKYVCFKEELSLGTILYGTMIDNHFICETIHVYKNENVGGNYMTKINLIKDILQTSIKNSHCPSVSFHLPQMSNSKFLLECSNLPYQVYGILQIKENRPKIFILHHLFGHFQIKKDYSLEDVYNLYAYNEKNELAIYSTALVNDFKTSHFLKKAFKIKQTYKNIEFSDDEDDTNESEVYVSCLYIHEFKKWKPYILKQGNPDFIKTIVFKEKKNIAL